MIEDVFGAGGALAAKFPGYAPRKGQVDMAKAVETAIAGKHHLIAEGPTGTGKTLAYLVPAIEWATQTQGKRVLVVTGNIALQEQLVEKDLPLLKEVMGRKFEFALSKGKNNYLCMDQMGKSLAGGMLSEDVQMARLIEWAQQTQTGDVSEFPETPPPRLWKQLSTTSDECKGSSCKHYKDCFAEQAKRRTQSAQVVVTNYHMFFNHLKVRAKMRQLREQGAPVEMDIVLPPADVIVFDEAHKAADICRDFLGFQMSKSQIDWLVRGFNHEMADECRRAAEAFFKALSAHKQSKLYKARLKAGHGIDGEHLARSLELVGRFYKSNADGASWSPDERAELEMRARRAYTLAKQVREACAPEQNPGSVYFIEDNAPPSSGGSRDMTRASTNVTLKSKPIHVGEWMAQELFSQFATVVLTSATLSTSTGKAAFAFLKKDMGLDLVDRKTEEMIAESPFTWKDQVLLCVPDTMSDAKDFANFGPSVAKHVRQIAETTRGRMLGLFTSFKVLEQAATACRGLPYRIFKHGEMPRTMLTQKFREDVSSCLLGCESFWAGVDVPGESLSCVVIDRLPFPTLDDPIVDAIAAKDDKWFFNYAVPRSIIAFKQGFGRLIRSTTDRGVVVVLDRRLLEMSYGRSFIASLPKGIGMTRSVPAIAKFLG
jgi:ATP-dependent DNA helicase DinG